MEKPTKAPMWEEDRRSAHECCSGEVREVLRERWRGGGGGEGAGEREGSNRVRAKEEGAD